MQWSDVIGEERRGNVLGVDQRAKGTYAARGGVARKCTGMRERARVWTCIEQVERGLWVVRGKRFGVSQKEQALHEQRARGRREAGVERRHPQCAGVRADAPETWRRRCRVGSRAATTAAAPCPRPPTSHQTTATRLAIEREGCVGRRDLGVFPAMCGVVGQCGRPFPASKQSSISLQRWLYVERTCESQENELNQFRKC